MQVLVTFEDKQGPGCICITAATRLIDFSSDIAIIRRVSNSRGQPRSMALRRYA